MAGSNTVPAALGRDSRGGRVGSGPMAGCRVLRELEEGAPYSP